MSDVVIGLDLGTTAVKAVAFGPGGPVAPPAERPCPGSGTTPGTQDPEAIVAAAADALAACAAALPPARAVAAIGISAAMHGLVGLDAAARPMTPLLTWADPRAGEEARALSGRAAELLRATGTPVHPMSPLVKLRRLRAREPELFGRVRTWAGLKEIALHALTGEVVTEWSSASGTGLFDPRTRDWHAGALALAGITPARLAPVVPVTAALRLTRQFASRTGLPAGTPVIAGAADGPLGNLGTGATAPGIAGLSVGTSAALRLTVPEPYADPRGALFCYALTDHLFVTGAALANAGNVLAWARRVFGAADTVPEGGWPSPAEAVPPGCDGLVMDARLLPGRGPGWADDPGGSFTGVRPGHGPAHFVRAAAEAVARDVTGLAALLDGVTPVTAVRATGGALRSPLMRRVLAATLDRPLYAEAAVGGSALGAAALALYAIGGAAGPADAAARFGAGSGARVPADPDEAAAYRRIAEEGRTPIT